MPECIILAFINKHKFAIFNLQFPDKPGITLRYNRFVRVKILRSAKWPGFLMITLVAAAGLNSEPPNS